METNFTDTNNANRIEGKKIAILVEEAFEQVELTDPRRALDEAGAVTHVVSPRRRTVRAWNHADWGDSIPVDVHLDEADPAQYDAILLPGGVKNPDTLRMNDRAVRFVRHFYDEGKPIASICHGPWLLVEADIVKRRRVTSYPSLKTDLENAGAKWVDEEVVVDKGIITSRKPDDIPAFNRKVIEEIAEGKHGKRHRRRARTPGRETGETHQAEPAPHGAGARVPENAQP
jgi:protease I